MSFIYWLQSSSLINKKKFQTKNDDKIRFKNCCPLNENQIMMARVSSSIASNNINVERHAYCLCLHVRPATIFVAVINLVIIFDRIFFQLINIVTHFFSIG